ncbi:heme exporter protein B [Inhella inkyongensis]|uniref:Heme exporter protein B n=1 Tax=Inhella inkyongensis TaxID=392593 RepID=A0A840S1K5_9BURK|nr:heme exporter protein CcmB [Inhella inkyongensis]MBB5205027.1 heme exporter protein B [Inhella inkyongensis]
MSGLAFATTVIRRELRLAARRPTEALLPVVFFVVAASLFPLGIGPEPDTLRHIAPGVLWVGALLATLLSLGPLWGGDWQDGSLDQLLLAGQPAWLLALAKAVAHWLTHGLPLLLAAPLLALMFGLTGMPLAVLMAGLGLGTPVLSLLGAFGAALTLGLRAGGLLNLLIVLPLAIPTLIFGSGAVGAYESGLAVGGHLSLLGALLIATLLGAPPATAAALKIATQ